MPIIVGTLESVPRNTGNKIGWIGNLKKSSDSTDHGATEICENIEKNDGDLGETLVTQLPAMTTGPPGVNTQMQE